MILEKSLDEQQRHARTKVYFLKRRAGKYSLPHNITPEHWLAILTTFDERCAYCGQSAEAAGAPLTADHFLPACDPARLGSVVWNILPVCKSCNWSKDGRDPFIWLEQRFGREQGRLIAQRVLLYLVEARYWYYAERRERRLRRT